MQQPSVYILCTRPLDQSLIDNAAKRNIIIEALSFIQTNPTSESQVAKQITDLSGITSPVVFTSTNAVKAVATRMSGRQPAWKIFCIGSATKDLIRICFPHASIEGAAQNASMLADEIIKLHPSSVVFFCGDRRRPDLPAKLAAHNINLREIIVYNTAHKALKTRRDYDGILFFSPSAAESFLTFNTPAAHTILFAVGSTTADYLRSRCSNTVVAGNIPAEGNLVEKVIEYFTTSNHTHVSVKE